jgi:lipoate-protein ligase A
MSESIQSAGPTGRLTSFEGQTWRLLDTGAGSGAWNMAVDEAMLEGHRLGLAPPTLRLYRWERPTLSLGYAQKVDGLDLEAIAAAGIDVVRRPTGGRAVLHAGDFTYAIVTSGLPEGVRASYEALAEGLAKAIGRLGLACELAPGELGAGRSADCFKAATQADLLAAGRKLIGSAQTRRAGAVLQHGSLYLRYPQDLARVVFGDGQPEIADLAGLLGRTPSWEEVAQAFTEGLSEHLGVRLIPGSFTPWETERAS